MPFHEYIKCRPEELKSAIEEFPLALVPFGAMEWHSYHLPLGFDGIKSEILLKRVGTHFNKGILFPTIYWGAYDTMNFPWTFHFSKRALQIQEKQFAQQLYSMGFRIIILLTGHYPSSQINILQNISLKLMKKYSDIYVLGIPEYYLGLDLDYIGDHAAMWETALGLALMPEITDLSAIPENLSYMDRCRKLGIMGVDPKIKATPELGIKTADLICSRLIEAIDKTWTEQSQKYFLEIIQNAKNKMQSLHNLRNLDNTAKLIGMDSKKDFKEFAKWTIFHQNKMQN